MSTPPTGRPLSKSNRTALALEQSARHIDVQRVEKRRRFAIQLDTDLRNLRDAEALELPLGWSALNRAAPVESSHITVCSGEWSIARGSCRNICSAIVWLPIRYAMQSALSPVSCITGCTSFLK